MNPSQGPMIGVVAIGRNEGDRLRQCLESALAPDRHIVYVDSGSTDGSVEMARARGIEVVELDTSVGFTAARARNAGFARLLELEQELQFVQFVDGDCQLATGWIEKAADFLVANPSVAAVCGRRREIDPNRNVYHRLVDHEWDTPVGEAKACGGDALFRVSPLCKLSGYRDTLIAGEEPELCVRLRAAGWKIHRLDSEMTLHDVRIDSWRQWWKRSVRAGHAFAEGAALHGAPPERHYVRETRSAIVWGFLVPLVAVALVWPTRGISLAVGMSLYLLLLVKTAASYRRHGWELGRSVLYATNCVAAKVPQFMGVLSYYVHRYTNTSPRIIEYTQD